MEQYVELFVAFTFSGLVLALAAQAFKVVNFWLFFH